MSPRSKKTSERMRAESRAKILAASRHLFATQGYFQCKVSDIAHEAGMSQGNIYWYFSSKEEILKAVLAEGFEAVESLLLHAQAHPGTGLEKLANAVQRYITFGKESIDFFTVFLSLFAQGGEAFFEPLGIDTLQMGQSFHEKMLPILAQAQSEGDIAAVDLDVLTMLFFGLFNGLIITYGDSWTALPAELIQNAVFRLVGAKY